MIRVIIPAQLGSLTDAPREVELEVAAPVTQRRILNALETAHPGLRGMLRDTTTSKRRPMIRFFVAEEDVSHEDADADLGEEVASGKEPFWIIAAISGGQQTSDDRTEPTSLDHTFSAPIGVDVKGEIWSCVEMPDSVVFFGTGKAVKVDTRVDGIDLGNVGFMPTGSGGHMLSISAKLRKQLGKDIGEDVTVHVTRRRT